MVPDAPLACFQNSVVYLRLVIVVAFHEEIVLACPTNVFVADAEMEDSCLADDDAAVASQEKEPSDALVPSEEASGEQ
jgi:hypothetical protein